MNIILIFFIWCLLLRMCSSEFGGNNVVFIIFVDLGGMFSCVNCIRVIVLIV